MQVGDGGAGVPRPQKKTGRNPATPELHAQRDALKRPRKAKTFPDTQKLQHPLRGTGLSHPHTGQGGSGEEDKGCAQDDDAQTRP